jgi:hypothetical protein
VIFRNMNLSISIFVSLLHSCSTVLYCKLYLIFRQS